jgi:hypothetical protein
MFCRLRDDRWRDGRVILLVGGFLGLVALLSPALLPTGALMIAGEFASQPGDRRRVAIGSLVMGLIAGLVIAPWVVRNYYALGGFVPLRSNFGLELAIGNNSLADGITFGTKNRVARLHPFNNPEERARLQSMGELAYMRDKQHVALRWIADHPAEALRLTMLRFRLYWFPTTDLWYPGGAPSRGLKATIIGSAGLKATIIGLISAAALLHLAYLAVARHDRAWLLTAAVVGPSLIYMVTHVSLRYRYLTFGLCTLLAFDFLGSVWCSIARRMEGWGRMRALSD